MNEPVPALHASFMAQSMTRPSSRRMYFRVLAADFEDGVDARIVVAARPRHAQRFRFG